MHTPQIGETVKFQSYHKEDNEGTGKVEHEELGLYTIRVIEHKKWSKGVAVKIFDNKLFKLEEDKKETEQNA